MVPDGGNAGTGTRPAPCSTVTGRACGRARLLPPAATRRSSAYRVYPVSRHRVVSLHNQPRPVYLVLGAWLPIPRIIGSAQTRQGQLPGHEQNARIFVVSQIIYPQHGRDGCNLRCCHLPKPFRPDRHTPGRGHSRRALAGCVLCRPFVSARPAVGPFARPGGRLKASRARGADHPPHTRRAVTLCRFHSRANPLGATRGWRDWRYWRRPGRMPVTTPPETHSRAIPWIWRDCGATLRPPLTFRYIGGYLPHGLPRPHVEVDSRQVKTLAHGPL